MEELAVLFVLVLIAGWFLGVIGFFKALSARAEIAALRRRIEALAAGQKAPVAAAEPLPASVPFVPSPQVVEQAEPQPSPVAAEPIGATPPASEPDTAVTQRPDIEALLTARWGVWLGAAALVLAGVFLVRYAVDEGLLGPASALRAGRAARRRSDRCGGMAAPARGPATRHHRPGSARIGRRRRRRAVRRRLRRRRAVRTGAAAGRVRAAGRGLADRAGDLAAAWATGRRGRARRRLRHAGAGADREPVAARPVRLPAVRHRHRAGRGPLHGLDLARLGHHDRRRRLGAAGDRRRDRQRHLGAGTVRAGGRGTQSRPAAAVPRWIIRSAAAWPGCRARRSARPDCCWPCSIRAGRHASAFCCSCR